MLLKTYKHSRSTKNKDKFNIHKQKSSQNHLQISKDNQHQSQYNHNNLTSN